jgi:hypothetical protein
MSIHIDIEQQKSILKNVLLRHSNPLTIAFPCQSDKRIKKTGVTVAEMWATEIMAAGAFVWVQVF